LHSSPSASFASYSRSAAVYCGEERISACHGAEPGLAGSPPTIRPPSAAARRASQRSLTLAAATRSGGAGCGA
jgi:hypothetical protein